MLTGEFLGLGMGFGTGMGMGMGMENGGRLKLYDCGLVSLIDQKTWENLRPFANQVHHRAEIESVFHIGGGSAGASTRP